jgi:hypothetical protein
LIHNEPVRTVRVTRYVTPLREGGSLPAIVEADDDGLYVLKFRGAGHGVQALIAELVAGEMARALGLLVPEIVLASLDPDLARTEPDPEIHALIHDSAGLNLALDFLPGSVAYDPIASAPAPVLASQIVWFDAYVTNVDRTARNTNMLMWHRRLWLIDHGSSMYFHHTPGWEKGTERAKAPFVQIKDHVLLRYATALSGVDASMAALLNESVLAGILDLVPNEWLTSSTSGLEAPVARAAYLRYFADRLAAPRAFLQEAVGAR